MRRTTIDDRRNPVVDTALHENRNRKACNVFHEDDNGEQSDDFSVRPQQRPQQRPRFPSARPLLVDRKLVDLASVESTPPPLRGVGHLFDGSTIGCGHRPSASVVTNRRPSLSNGTRDLFKASCSSRSCSRRLRSSSSCHVQLRSASSHSSSAASR